MSITLETPEERELWRKVMAACWAARTARDPCDLADGVVMAYRERLPSEGGAPAEEGLLPPPQPVPRRECSVAQQPGEPAHDPACAKGLPEECVRCGGSGWDPFDGVSDCPVCDKEPSPREWGTADHEPSTVPDAPGLWQRVTTFGGEVHEYAENVYEYGGELVYETSEINGAIHRVSVGDSLWLGRLVLERSPVRRDPAPADAGPQLAAIGRTLGQCEDETVEQAAARVMAEIVSRVDREVDLMRELDKARAQPADAGLRARVEAIARKVARAADGSLSVCRRPSFEDLDGLLRTALDAEGPDPLAGSCIEPVVFQTAKEECAKALREAAPIALSATVVHQLIAEVDRLRSLAGGES